MNSFLSDSYKVSIHELHSNVFLESLPADNIHKIVFCNLDLRKKSRQIQPALLSQALTAFYYVCTGQAAGSNASFQNPALYCDASRLSAAFPEGLSITYPH